MEILTQIATIIKAIGAKPMMELVKHWWIKFAIGVAIMAYPLAHLIETILRVLK